ncbi:MAG: PKD domain-containing protein [Candidatus Absconditabacteria bacterium]
MKIKAIPYLVGIAILNISFSFGLPNEYYSNYRIENSYKKVINIIEDIEAYKTTSGPASVPTKLYGELSGHFKTLFPNFPTDSEYKIIYKQCEITSAKLSKAYSYDDFASFSDQCIDGLDKIIKEVNDKHSVKASIAVKSKQGSAPFTVTFDGTRSVDPSDQTIPENNYYWYYKNMDGVLIAIGKGPIISHTFERAGSYVVHLTVRSSNNKNGVLDGSDNISINVTPEAARIKVYANGKQLLENYSVKYSTQEAERGILFDGSGTVPLGKRKITSYKREIKSGDSFDIQDKNNGNPAPFRAKLRSEGRYNVTLTIRDNENNVVSKSYQITISDPIATIKANPGRGTTSTTYTFDAGASYSTLGKIKSYKWTIYDPNANPIGDYSETQSFMKKFTTPGQYTVKLNVNTDQGEEDSDVLKFDVESTSPVAQFTITPVKDRKYPSQFVLDATPSYDYDVLNKVDNLKYEWSVLNTNSVDIKNVDDGAKAIFSFNEVGNHIVKLTVTDSYGKISEIEKTIKVESTLRPELIVTPIVAQWGEDFDFSVNSNKTIANYVWNFGDEITRQTNSNRITHKYSKVGVYTVKLKVNSVSGEENEINRQIFVGEKGNPIVSYKVYFESETNIVSDTFCSIKDSNGDYIDNPAYTVERYQKFILNASSSVNAKGQNNNLKIYFKPQNDDIKIRNIIDYNFSEIGCSYIDISIEDLNISKTQTSRVWFKVVNSLPKISNIVLSYPQYGNESGIGFNETNNSNIFENVFDPLIVKVTAQGARDLDGQISHFRWYYYEKDDPESPLEVKITPNNVANTVFSIPRISGKYSFGVEIYDDSNESITSEEIIGQGPLIIFPPDTKNPDIPMVSLKSDRVNSNVGDEITFTVNADILSKRPDFKGSRIIKYDFDGDGSYDLTTKKDKVTHTYKEPGKYKPKVKVIYRGYAGIDYSEKIEVKKGLKSMFLYDSIGAKILVRDISFGDIEERNFCLKLPHCKKDKKYMINSKEFFLFEYPDDGNKNLLLSLKDKYGNQESMSGKVLINIERDTLEDLTFLSIPNAERSTGGNYNISVGNNLDNSVGYYIQNNLTGDCFVDIDILNDSNGDGESDNDRDFACGKEKMVVYKPGSLSTISRIYYYDGDELITKDIEVNFLDADDTLLAEFKDDYDSINLIIEKIADDKDDSIVYLKTLLTNLKASLGDNLETSSLIIQINDWLDENMMLLDESLENEIKLVIKKLSDGATQAALGGSSEYDISKANILIFISDSSRDEVDGLFEKIEQSNGNRDEIQGYINEIMQIAVKENENKKLDIEDLNLIKTDLCKILEYYGIPSDKCGTGISNCGDGICSEGEDCESCEIDCGKCESKGGIFSTILKIVARVFGIIASIFIVLTIVFAIKAKRQQTETNNEEE